MILVFAASGAGIAATRLLPNQPGAAAVLVAFSVAGALVSLIIAFGKLSGGHFNPLITLVQWLTGERSYGCALAYVVAQCIGGLAGGVLAAALWHVAPAGVGGLASGGVASEFVASTGLLLIVLGAARSGRPETGPFAVGAWLVAGVIATPTGSFANPAVVLGAMATAGPIALGPASALPYVAAQIGGAVVALGIISMTFPKRENN